MEDNTSDIKNKKNKDLTTSELRYRRLFETAQDGILLIDFKTGMILDVNKFLIDLLDYSKSDFLKKYLWDVGVFKDVAASKDNFLTLQKKRYVRFEDLPLETKTGKQVNVEFVANAYQVDGETIIQCNIRDITDRKRAEYLAKEALRQSEEKFFKAFQISPYAITITLLNSGKFIDVNDTFLSMTGFSRKEVLDSSSLKLKWWVDKSARQQILSKLTVDRPIINNESLFKKKNGETFTGLFSAAIIKLSQGMCILSSIADITERIKAEQLVNEVKTRDEAILNSIGDAVFATDKNGDILLFNKMAEEMTGISVKEAIGHNYKQTIIFIKESDGKPSNDFIAQAIDNNVITKMANHVLLVRKDGQTLPVADSAAPIKDSQGNMIGCVVVFHNVTKERQIDKAKTEFVSLASHQLRTPLSTINWYVEMLLSLDVGKLTPKQREYSQEVYHASQRMVNLVNALLNVSRLELGTFAVEPKMVNIVNIAKNCLKELTPLILKKKLIFKFIYDKSALMVKVDPKLMAIVFQNFLSNSVKYTQKDGKIVLKISKTENSVLISVSDNGIGIPLEQQKNIFEKLYRADNAKKFDPDGTGLGLYIVKEIIDYTGGKVWFKSVEGKETTFYTSLPLTGMFTKKGNKKLI